MHLEQQIEAYLAVQLQSSMSPEEYQQAREALLNSPRQEVMAFFESRWPSASIEDCGRYLHALADLYGQDATEFLLRGLDSTDTNLRWVACGCLHDVGDSRAVPALTRLMHHDSDAQIRGLAVSAIGNIGGIDLLPDLEQVQQTDQEEDELGFSPSYIAMEAISDLLRSWTIRQLQAGNQREFQEVTSIGQARGQVIVEAIPFDELGRIMHTKRYAGIPLSAMGHGWGSHLDLTTTLVPPFEIDVLYEGSGVQIGRRFVFQQLKDGGEINWSVNTIIDPNAINSLSIGSDFRGQ